MNKSECVTNLGGVATFGTNGWENTGQATVNPHVRVVPAKGRLACLTSCMPWSTGKKEVIDLNNRRATSTTDLLTLLQGEKNAPNRAAILKGVETALKPYAAQILKECSIYAPHLLSLGVIESLRNGTDMDDSVREKLMAAVLAMTLDLNIHINGKNVGRLLVEGAVKESALDSASLKKTLLDSEQREFLLGQVFDMQNYRVELSQSVRAQAGARFNEYLESPTKEAVKTKRANNVALALNNLFYLSGKIKANMPEAASLSLMAMLNAMQSNSSEAKALAKELKAQNPIMADLIAGAMEGDEGCIFHLSALHRTGTNEALNLRRTSALVAGMCAAPEGEDGYQAMEMDLKLDLNALVDHMAAKTQAVGYGVLMDAMAKHGSALVQEGDDGKYVRKTIDTNKDKKAKAGSAKVKANFVPVDCNSADQFDPTTGERITVGNAGRAIGVLTEVLNTPEALAIFYRALLDLAELPMPEIDESTEAGKELAEEAQLARHTAKTLAPMIRIAVNTERSEALGELKAKSAEKPAKKDEEPMDTTPAASSGNRRGLRKPKSAQVVLAPQATPDVQDTPAVDDAPAAPAVQATPVRKRTADQQEADAFKKVAVDLKKQMAALKKETAKKEKSAVKQAVKQNAEIKKQLKDVLKALQDSVAAMNQSQ